MSRVTANKKHFKVDQKPFPKFKKGLDFFSETSGFSPGWVVKQGFPYTFELMPGTDDFGKLTRKSVKLGKIRFEHIHYILTN